MCTVICDLPCTCISECNHDMHGGDLFFYLSKSRKVSIDHELRSEVIRIQFRCPHRTSSLSFLLSAPGQDLGVQLVLGLGSDAHSLFCAEFMMSSSGLSEPYGGCVFPRSQGRVLVATNSPPGASFGVAVDVCH